MRAFLWPAVALLTVSAVQPQAQGGRQAVEAQARLATERLRTLQREADQLALEARSLLVDLRRFELDREIRTEEARQADVLLKDTAAALDETGRRIAALEQQALTERPGISGRLVEIYKRGRGGYMRMLLGLEDVRSFGRAYRAVSAMAALDRRRFAEHRDTLGRLRDSRAELTKQIAAQTTAEQQARRARVAADAAVAARTRLIAAIDARRDLNAQLTGELQSAQQRLQQSLASLSAGRGAAAEAVVLPLAPFRGEVEWPAPGPVLSPFGRLVNTRPGAAAQNGIEIGSVAGREIRAVHEGTVAYANPFTGFGRLVILDHGTKNYTLYGYLAEVRVAPGERVTRGQALGTSGTSPKGTPALYFELRIDGRPVNPLQWLKRR